MTITREQFVQRLTERAEKVIAGHQAEYAAAHPHPGQYAGGWEDWARGEAYRAGGLIARWAERVPRLWRGADLDRLTPAQAPDVVRGFLPSSARNLMLAGPVGTGKSFAAWAVAHEAAAWGLVPRAWSLPRLLLDMRPDGDPSAFHDACTTPLLLIDDLGAARPTDWAAEQIYSIAEERTNNELRTVITTNSTLDELTDLWGDPTIDRFADMAVSVEMLGESRRGPA